MITKAPQIGFDRFIPLDWVAAALDVCAGRASPQQLHAKLTAAGLGKEALDKTQTKLKALALEPRADLVDFIGRGVAPFVRAESPGDILPFAWGAAIVAYPYFGKVAEFTGRLTAIQGDCSVAEIHRRMSEVYGDREVVKRATQAVLQTQSDWGAVKRVESGKRLIRTAQLPIADKSVVAWLLEAAVRYHGRAVALAGIQSAAVLYPFTLDQPLGFVVSTSDALELRTEGAGERLVALRAAR